MRDTIRSWRITWQLHKFFGTLKLAWTLIVVRTFGEYVVTECGPDQPDLAVYWYKGNRYYIPTQMMKRWDA